MLCTKSRNSSGAFLIMTHVKEIGPRMSQLAVLRLNLSDKKAKETHKVKRNAGEGTSSESPHGGHKGSPSSVFTPWRYTSSKKAPDRLHSFSVKEVAGELALMDAESLRKIRPCELENGAWMDKKKHELAPNIMAMVSSFNRLALLVPTEVLQEKTPQARSKVISAFIQLARKCYSLRNFNSLKAVLAGLQSTPIHRLKKTWKEVPSKRKKKFDQLSRLMSEENNWQLYREKLDHLMQTNTPFIPFLGNFLTHVVQQKSFSGLQQQLGEASGRRRKSSVFETYTILEPITIRNWLERTLSGDRTEKRSLDNSNASLCSICSTNDSCSTEHSSDEMLIDDQCGGGGEEEDGGGGEEEDGGMFGSSCDVEISFVGGEVSTDQDPCSNEHTESASSSNLLSSSQVTVEICTEESSSSSAAAVVENSTSNTAHDRSMLSPTHVNRLLEPAVSSGDNSDLSLSDLSTSTPSKQERPELHPPLGLQPRKKSISMDCLLDTPWEEQLPEPSCMSKSTSVLPEIKIEDSFRTSNVIDLDGSQTLPRNFRSYVSTPNDLTINKDHVSSAVTSSRRRRHTAGSIAKICQDSSSPTESFSPFDLLHRYQLLSIGCCDGLESRNDLKTFLCSCAHNTEGQNYQLSYSKEP